MLYLHDVPSPERFLLVMLMLLGASWSDMQSRRVANRYWIPFSAAAALLWSSGLMAGGPDLQLRAIGAIAMTAAAYLLWRLGMFGGADAKGLMVFAWLWPGTPDLLAGRMLPVVDTLVNAAFAAVLLPLLFLLVNGLRGDLQLPAALLGTRMPLRAAEARHVWPMQRIPPGEASPKWRFWQRPSEPLLEVYGRLRVHGIDPVWVTPKIPFMVLLAMGAVVAALWGNLVLLALVPD